ncbi:condensin complex subunit 2 [Linepithema humile]|uniref:condensin complex subunit 2 n=1 Tax=Linepithema humile TaxID=83485 RepID=UPI0006239195|nr:PREDICTED: condensin complex subunit 2 [Linepithema humile]
MESRKSMIHKRIESVVQSLPSESSPSPLRRKSIIAQNSSLNILENDDEAERIARRREMGSTSTPLSINNHSSKRHSLGLGFLANIPAPQMAESINQCIKLSTENKISIKNAFGLEMIDFMTYMIKKQDANMSNLQVASTSLDVSTKIYGFRVDSVHTEILKIVGGLDHQIADKQNSKEQENTLEEGTEANVDVQKKKRKKNKQRIISTAEALRVNIDIVKPMCMQVGEEDLQTTDMLYQAMLPNHANSGFYQHLYNDVLVDVEDNAESRSNSSTKYITPIIDDSSNSEICMSYSNFEFLGWSVEDEPEEMPDKEAELSIDDGNRFQFDLNASVAEEEEHNGTNNVEPMNYFDIEHEDGNINSDVGGCYQQAAGANRRNDNIVDVQVSAQTLASEYSFVQQSVSLHWAGPSHWKFRNFAKHFNATTTTDSKVMEACMQAPTRQRKQIVLSYDEMNHDVIKAKFILSQLNRLQAKTVKSEWSTESVTLPEDVHYDVTQMTKQYLHQSLTVANNSKKRDNAVTNTGISDNERFDYNNPNDTSEYCLDVNNDYDDGDKDDCNFEDAAALATQGFTGENLVAAPKLANKMSIAYCVKAKKIDMRQLKETMWKSLKSTNEKLVKETEGTTMSKKFSSIYKMLPNLLSKTNVEALSAPVAFLSLLHLTNENNLQISSQSDLSDVAIEDS